MGWKGRQMVRNMDKKQMIARKQADENKKKCTDSVS